MSRASISALSRILLAVAPLAGCTGSTSTPTGAAGPTRPEPAPIVVGETVVSPFSDAELERQFWAARADLLAGRAKQAADAFDKLARLAPRGLVAAPSLLNAGIAYDTIGDPTTGALRYRALLERFPEHELAREGLLRMSRDLAYLERWAELEKTADALLARTDLTVLAQIEARGAKGLALVSQDRLDEAARVLGKASDDIEANRLGEAGQPPLELAQVAFALGEVRKKKSERIVFTPEPPNLADVLERRCQGLLDAQNAYTDAMKSLDAHWSAMAGYRVGELYQKLHEDVMRIAPPARSDTVRKKQLFEGAMRLRFRVLLEKGLAMMEGTVRLGDRTGESSAWVERARKAKAELDQALADEKAALAKMPFTEDEMRAALNELAAKQARKPAP